MRLLPFAALAIVAGCSASPSTDNQATTAEATAPVTASAEQRAAQAVAAGYLSDIETGDFAAARARWAEDGAASGGSAADLARGYSGYGNLALTAGMAGAVSIRGDGARVVVPVSGRATMKGSGERRAMAGNIYLQRAPGSSPGATSAPGWQIWAADIRPEH